MIAGLSELDSLKKALARHVNQLSGLWAYLPHPVSSGRVRMVALVDNPCIQTDDVSLVNDVILMGNPVDHLSLTDTQIDAGYPL